MSDDPTNNFLVRGRPVHQPVHSPDNRSIIIFLTVCTKDRRPTLASAEMQHALRTAWNSATHWMVGRYVIMPDHIHLFCTPGTYPPTPLANWVSYWKRLVVFSQAASCWQKNFWDTQLRHHESYAQKWDYVRNNPVRADLVADPEAWPYQGELNILRWHN